jgi:hypothetical protein
MMLLTLTVQERHEREIKTSRGKKEVLRKTANQTSLIIILTTT